MSEEWIWYVLTSVGRASMNIVKNQLKVTRVTSMKYS